jgi:hypothetical protein
VAEQQVFHEKERVEAADDTLPGVPAGTPGKVIEVTGLSWIRYRVQFGNGIERNLIDGSHLRPRAPAAR